MREENSSGWDCIVSSSEPEPEAVVGPGDGGSAESGEFGSKKRIGLFGWLVQRFKFGSGFSRLVGGDEFGEGGASRPEMCADAGGSDTCGSAHSAVPVSA